MGTRALIHVREDVVNTILTIYRQYDGYPQGLGRELAEFLSVFKMVNGLEFDQKGPIANGMGCLAAQIVVHFKTKPGNVYIYPPNSHDVGEEFTYGVFLRSEGVLRLTVQDRRGHVIFTGTPSDFLECQLSGQGDS